ncbi:DEAD/DEAH box helicase [Inconstantimicrobium mannanitabidum]|uniref:ATP-dependent RNA helicase DbpA n=1 Tax=Inconstantimicrobium mannanitabidum TaxID=1604901 RepID=A0ACB5R9M9_9CLOT|nr:DEAD/DEAH box helicase [Clostridium sp. TW13]GKX65728.1 ATP-dependent RNA helicase DbpA [Clostridium sp. TW13]
MEKEINFKQYNLSKEVLKAIDLLGYKKPSKVQSEVIPLILNNKDIIAKSQTGSGKTAAFGIPLCERIQWEENKPQALVLTPTRELCVQVKEDISNIGKFKRVKCTAVFGKQPFSIQARELKQRTHVVVGTPGRTLDHIKRETLSLEKIEYLVIDEADEMLNMGFIEQVGEIIDLLPKKRVTLLFSATMPEEILSLCTKYMKNPSNIEIKSQALVTEKIKHRYFEVQENGKLDLLEKILIIDNPETCIMFCRTKDNVEKVCNFLKNRKYPCERLHGGMLQKDRLEVMQSFKRGEFPFLVATDVAARGIDVENITEVINVDIPLEKESYVHRIGRTGRAGKEGLATTFVTPFEDRFFTEIEEYISLKIEKDEEPKEKDVTLALEAFEERLREKPKAKQIKSDALKKDIMKIYLNGGKKKKIRAGDIVGAVCNIQGLTAEDIGIIDIQDNVSYVDILNGKGKIVLNGLRKTTIKGKPLKVQIAKD